MIYLESDQIHVSKHTVASGIRLEDRFSWHKAVTSGLVLGLSSFLEIAVEMEFLLAQRS